MAIDEIIDAMISIHPLERVPRAGFLLRGVTEPESVAAHSHSLALLTLMACNEYPDDFDSSKAVEMALIHDIQEVQTMDIPLPVGSAEFRAAKEDTEEEIFKRLFAGVSPALAERYAEFRRCDSPEAKLVRGLDKVQMMVKVLCYQRENRGHLDEFWEHRHNFPDFDMPVLNALFEAVARKAGRKPPR